MTGTDLAIVVAVIVLTHVVVTAALAWFGGRRRR